MRIRPASRLAAGSPLAIGVTLWASATFFGSGAAARGPSGGSAEPSPSRRIDRLVAGDGRLFALRDGEIVTFDGAGQQLGRCSAFAAPPAHDNRSELGAPDAEEVLRAAGLPDDDSTQDAEDALDDEGLGTKRQARPLPSPGIEPRALSAAPGAEFAWVATSSGVFRGNESGCAPAGLSGRDLVAVAADDGIVLAASEDLLFRRETGGAAEDQPGIDDDSATFMVAAGLTSRPRALAVGPAGEAIVADDDGVSIIGRDDTATRILDRATDAIAVCDGVAAVLSTDGVYAWRPGMAVARLGDRPPARALACGPIPDQRWIATGLGVWTSADGATWVERPELLGRSVAGAAWTGDRLWLAVDNGLYALDPSGDPREAWPAGTPRPIGDLSGGGWSTLPTRRLRVPFIPWPWVTAMLTSDRTPDRHAWSAMVLLTFPLGRLGARRVDPTALASELVRRDVALAAEEIDLLAAPPDDEVDARLAAVRREREALR